MPKNFCVGLVGAIVGMVLVVGIAFPRLDSQERQNPEQVKVFHERDDMEIHVNEWLREHPSIDVTRVTQSEGDKWFTTVIIWYK